LLVDVDQLQSENKKIAIADKMVKPGSVFPMLDLNFFSQYHSEIGFRVGVEAIHNCQENAFFGVIMSVCPSA